MIYVACLILILAVLYYVVQPFLQKKYRLAFSPNPSLNTAHSDLQQTKREYLYALKDLEFEYQTGKISSADYHKLKREYESGAIDVMRKIENSGNGSILSDALEKEIARHRAELKKRQMPDNG